METLVCAPTNSLVEQSLCAAEAATITNGDGVGLGWYGRRADPAIYRDVRPAWSDENLKGLCRHVESHLFFAHVRASTGAATARSNCHPFAVGPYMFMHNGQIGGFNKIRRRVEALVGDEFYCHRAGGTDSEILFLALLSRLQTMSVMTAMSTLLNEVCAIMHEFGIQEALRFTAAFTDGKDLYAFRWSSDAQVPSLYWCERNDGMIVVSEPLDQSEKKWQSVPPGYMLLAPAQGQARLLQLEGLKCAAA